MSSDLPQRLNEIKRSFRLMMDGAAARSMRDKGAQYHVNWGAPLPLLREKAREIGPDYSLAVALWNEDVRECKILATYIMPPEEMTPQLAELWLDTTSTQEMAELASMNLYCRLPFAADKAYQWIASADDKRQLCGFHILARLFANGQEPNERGINEYIDQAQAALQGASPAVRKAAAASLNRFAQLGLMYERIARSAAKSAGLQLF